MAILTLLRSAQPADCHDIYHVHEYAVQYTCRHGYDPVVLEAWRELLAPESYLETCPIRSGNCGWPNTKAISKAFSSLI